MPQRYQNITSATAAQSGQALNWDYDRYGNHWHQNVTLGSAGTSSLSFSGNNNRVDGETYDAAGNVTNVGSRVFAPSLRVKDIFSFPGGRRFHCTDPSGNELAVWSDT